MDKELYYDNTFLGVLGEKTGKRVIEANEGINEWVDLHVGDIVSFYEYERLYTKPVVKNHYKKEYGVFGSDKLDFSNITKILSYKDLTEDLFQKLQEPKRDSKRSYFKIKEIKRREMTIEEIEETLGYEIKIVK